ncbi:MAG: hypothetical protein ACRD3V_18150 [Vicinamibacteria bacterium]
MRIDNNHEGNGAGLVYLLLPDAPIAASALFSGLGTGQHTVSFWGRGNAQQCWINPFVRQETVIVEESGG